MTEIATRQAIAAVGRSGKMKVTGRLKVALDAMIWEGAKRKEASAAAGMTDHSLRSALKKPHVLAHLRSELQALREGEKPRNVHRLAAIRDQDDNKAAAVAAIRTLEELTDGPKGVNVNVAIDLRAGYVIDLSEPGERPMIDVTPRPPA